MLRTHDHDQAPRFYFADTLLRARDYQDRPEFDRLCDWWRAGGVGVCARAASPLPSAVAEGGRGIPPTRTRRRREPGASAKTPPSRLRRGLLLDYWV